MKSIIGSMERKREFFLFVTSYRRKYPSDVTYVYKNVRFLIMDYKNVTYWQAFVSWLFYNRKKYTYLCLRTFTK